MLAGVAPIPANSGQVTNRYRLNRYGDRQLNRVLHIIVQSRIRYDPRPATTWPAAPPRARPAARSNDASRATSPATSTDYSKRPHHGLRNNRSVARLWEADQASDFLTFIAGGSPNQSKKDASNLLSTLIPRSVTAKVISPLACRTPWGLGHVRAEGRHRRPGSPWWSRTSRIGLTDSAS